MYRLCLTSLVLFALGTGASLAQGTSTSAADPIATIDEPAPTAVDSSSTAASTSTPSAEPSPAVENDGQPARETKRSTRRHAAPASTKTDENEPTKTVEIKDTGERTVCEDIGLPGSRMVVGKRCRTYNIYDRSDMKQAEQKKEQTKQAIAEVRRMQDNLELEQRQREWDRERATAALVLGSH
jgi:hypothetical protein